jgi:hypothetical protein
VSVTNERVNRQGDAEPAAGLELVGLWRRTVDLSVGQLRTAVGQWKIGEPTELYGVVVRPSPAFAEQVLAAAAAAGRDRVAEGVARGKAPESGYDPVLGTRLREIVAAVAERDAPIEAATYPRGAQAHARACPGPPCGCPDYVRWMADRAAVLDPDLESDIKELALRRALRAGFPDLWPATSYLARGYLQLRADVLRKIERRRRRETTDEQLDSTPSGCDEGSGAVAQADLLASALPSDLVGVDDLADAWTDVEARQWLGQDPIGKYVLGRIEAERLLRRSIVRDGRVGFVAVVVTAAARHAIRSGVHRPGPLDRLLRPLLRKAVGGASQANRDARVHRAAPVTIELVMDVAAGPLGSP